MGLGFCQRRFCILKNIKLFSFLLICLFFLISCSNRGERLTSITLNGCFSNKSQFRIATELEQLTQEIEEAVNPSYDSMALAGCYSYQLGHHVLAEQWLNKAFSQSEKKDVKNIAAAALGLIYLRERQMHKIKPYIATAKEGSLGRWMLILYHIDYYRVTGHREYLSSAIKVLQVKHKEEGKTMATDRLLKHMQLIHNMDENCTNNPEADSCSVPDLNDEKQYLFDTATGRLAYLLKEPPYQSTEPPPQQSTALVQE